MLLSLDFYRWREQSNSLQQKCETALLEMKEEISIHKKRIEELNSMLSDTKRKKADVRVHNWIVMTRLGINAFKCFFGGIFPIYGECVYTILSVAFKK